MSRYQSNEPRTYTPQQEREFKDRALKRKRANAWLDLLAGIAQDVDQDDYEEDMARNRQISNEDSEFVVTSEDAQRSDSSSPLRTKQLTQHDEESINYRWAQIFNPSNSLVKDARVIEDTGTQVNFILPALAKACDLRIDATEPTVHQVITGQRFVADKWVQVELIGKGGRIYSESFYLAPPAAPIELLVGKQFLNRNPDAFLDERPTASSSLLNVQAKMTEQERAQIQVDQAAAAAQAADIERRKRRKQQQKAQERKQSESSKSSRSSKQ